MFYPYQIPSVLDDFSKNHIIYQEHRLKSIEDYCFCIWEMRATQELKNTVNNVIIPDTCIDLIINFITKEIFFVGFSRNTEILEMTGKIDFLGIRLKPGAFHSLFAISAEQIMDNCTNFSEIEKNNLINILEIVDTKERLKILEEYLKRKIKRDTDRFAIELINKLYTHPADKQIQKLLKGKSDKSIYRFCKKKYGLSPKCLLNILRLHFSLNSLLENEQSLNDIVYTCGFYDQSHLIKEIKKYTGISPLKLLEKYKR